MTKPLFAIVDGYGFVFRAFHSLPPLTRLDGTPVGAVYGFTNMLLKLKKDFHATHILIVFDSGYKNFRHDLYEPYKANRIKAPDDLVPQFPLVREVADALSIPYLEKIGFEADDIIASMAKIAEKEGFDVNILSSDKDLMQLVNDNIKMYDPIKNKIVDRQGVFEKFGVSAEKVLDLLALMGDASDNIPGVPGIGPKTAAELINEFGDLDGVFANLYKIKQQKRKDTLEKNKDLAYLSKKLLTLHDTLKFENTMDHYRVCDNDNSKLLDFLIAQNFKSLAAKFIYTTNLIEQIEVVKNKEISHQDIEKLDDLKLWLQNVDNKLAIYFEENPKTKHIISICLAYEENSYVKVLLAEKDESFNLFGSSNKPTFEQVKTILKPIIEDTSILIITYDAKTMLYKLNLSTFDDIMLMSYCLGAGLYSHDLQSICNQYLLNNNDHFIVSIFKLHQILKQKLVIDKVFLIYERIEKPLVKVLYMMEKTGIKVDSDKLKDLSIIYAEELKKLELEIFKIAECEFNIASPKQLAEILFGKLNLKSNNNKKLSTNVDVLEDLALAGHFIAKLLLRWRHISKLKNTYTDALVSQINPITERVHTNFSMAITSTGRLSSSEPNLQNIPIRSEEGNKIRSAFISAPGYKLIYADYSQIELRILAHIAKIDSLKQAFIENSDIHVVTASDIFNVPVDQVSSEMRRRAKTINFGIIYGISPFGLSEQLGISVQESKEYIDKYFIQYPGIKNYMEVTKSEARLRGFVCTLYGRKCYVPSIMDKNFSKRNFAERAAINAPIQGSNADIIKKAMIEIQRSLDILKIDCRMILQIHDELVFEAKEEIVEQAKDLIKDKMENIISLDVPLIVDIKHGSNWLK